METESFRDMSLRITNCIHDEQTALLLDHSPAHRFRTATYHGQVWRSAENRVCLPSLQDHGFHRRIARKHRLRLSGTTSQDRRHAVVASKESIWQWCKTKLPHLIGAPLSVLSWTFSLRFLLLLWRSLWSGSDRSGVVAACYFGTQVSLLSTNEQKSLLQG